MIYKARVTQDQWPRELSTMTVTERVRVGKG